MTSMVSMISASWRVAGIACLAAAWVLVAPTSEAEEAPSPALQMLVRALGQSSSPATQLNILRGINAGLKGQRKLSAPAEWPAIYEKLRTSQNAELREQAQTLAVIFGGGGALDELRALLADKTAPADRRKAALDSLVSARDAQTLPLLLASLTDAGPLRVAALRALSSFDDPAIPGAILKAYPNLASEEKRDALATLTMRPAWARELLKAVGEKKIARTDISAPLARQLQDLKDATIDEWLAKNWGAVRTSSAEKQKEIARFKTFLTPAAFEKADPSNGRAIFTRTCAICHTLFGTGAKIGPELPGAFEDVDYLLQNILDPNAIIGKDYQQTVVQLKDGQLLIGIVGADEGTSLTLKSLAGPVTIQKSDIASLKVLDVSLMPEGLLTALSQQEVVDLFSYLRRHGQVPMLASEANVNDFFNGTDLTRWISSSPKAWKVENGEIIGHGSADRAEFLNSELVVEGGRQTGELAISGPGASAEIVLHGQDVDGGFVGDTLRLSEGKAELLAYREPGKATVVETKPTTLSATPIAYEIVATPKSVQASLGGKPLFTAAGAGLTNRTVFGFRIAGQGAELRIKSLKLELPKS